MFTVKCSIPPPQGRLGGDSVCMATSWCFPHIGLCTELLIAREQTTAYISSMLVCYSTVALISQQALWQDACMW